MKKMSTRRLSIVLIALMAAVTAAMGATMKKKTVAWTEPGTLYANTQALRVTKVELTDTATTLHLHARYTPKYWIKIAAESCLKDRQGGTYALRSAESIVPGEQFWMPETGEHDFALRFEPLPEGTEMFDFTEGESEGSWKLFGIYNTATPPDFGIPAGLRGMTYTGNETLPAAAYSPGKTRVTCKIYGYRQEMGMEMRASFCVIGKSENESITAPVNGDGTATIEADIDRPLPMTIGVGDAPFAQIVAVPGGEVTCAVDMSKAVSGGNFFGFTGPMARTNNELSNLPEDVYALTEYGSDVLDGMRGLTEDECAAFLNSTLSGHKAAIDKLGCTDAVKQLLRMDVESTDLEMRYDITYAWTWAIARTFHPESREELDSLVKESGMPAFNGPLAKDMPGMECLDSDHALYGECLQSAPDYILQLPITDGYNSQWAKVNAYFRNVIEMDDDLSSTITDTHLHGLVEQKKADKKRMEDDLARMDNVFYHKCDDIAPEDILPTILKRHEGKAVLIDVWETWCSPCRRGHAQMKPLKEELKDSNVVFVYLASPSSPADTWKEMMEEISGEHYYLTPEQKAYVMSKYESQGIPTYLIFDTEGRLSFKQVGLPSNDVFRSEIEKAIKRP